MCSHCAAGVVQLQLLWQTCCVVYRVEYPTHEQSSRQHALQVVNGLRLTSTSLTLSSSDSMRKVVVSRIVSGIPHDIQHSTSARVTEDENLLHVTRAAVKQIELRDRQAPALTRERMDKTRAVVTAIQHKTVM